MKRSLAPLALCLLAGCRGSAPSLETGVKAAEAVQFNPEDVRVMQPVPGQRFVPTSSALVSFDTQTGSLCKTYEWGGSVYQTGLLPCDRLEWETRTPAQSGKRNQP